MSKQIKKVCINCSNLHNGGAVQVAASFLSELVKLEMDNHFSILCSSQVASNVDVSVLSLLKSRFDFRVVDIFGWRGAKPTHSRFLNEFAVIFTIFGPDYLLNVKAKRIVGFAQPWIIYPNNPVSKSLPWLLRTKLRLKFLIQGKMFLRANHLVVEAAHVKERLVALKGVDPDTISVVHNTISSLYKNLDLRLTEKRLVSSESELRFGLVSRGYPHKNICFIGKSLKELERTHKITATCLVTLSREEFCNIPSELKKYYQNVGPLKVSDCPEFYSKLDGVIFPSLLECFSATPMEALACGTRLFASDRRFVRDVCGDFPLYFDPLNPRSLVDRIVEYINEPPSSDLEVRKKGVIHANQFSSAEQRASKYISIINRFVEES